MKILSTLIVIFFYLEIFSQQTTGTNIVWFSCDYPEYTFCFTISDVEANWSIANDTCVQQGGKLTDYVYNLAQHQVYANTADNYWTGWRRVGESSEFNSTDEISTPSLSYWKYNNPKDGIDCVGYDAQFRQFLSLECDTKHTFVCETDYDGCNNRNNKYRYMCSSPVFNSGIPTGSSLKNLSLNFKTEIGDITEFYSYPQVLVIARMRANHETRIPINSRITILIGTDTFQENTTLVVYQTSNTSRFPKGHLSVYDDLITIYASNNSTENLTLLFHNVKQGECMHLRSNGVWSSEGLSTQYTNSEKTLLCSTYIQDTTTIGVSFTLKSSYVNTIESSSMLYNFATYTSVFITFISVLFLLSSVVIFINSGKQFFSHDINVLHFNLTLILLLAIISVSLIILIIFSLEWCLAVTFLLQFLWTNVFISSLSIAILVFYSIWIVSIKHTARKLYKYLIPIGWCVSLLWAVAWLVYDIFELDPCDTRDPQFKKCKLMNNANLRISWAFLGPITGILLINTVVLILSLIKIRFALKRQNSYEGEFKRLLKVAIGGILLIPALGLSFISLVVISILRDYEELDAKLAIPIIILINSPIGIMHFILITCQIKETVLRKFCCYCKSRCWKKTLPQLAHSLHLNVVRRNPRTKQETNETVIQEPVSTNDDVIQGPVSINEESTAYSNESTN